MPSLLLFFWTRGFFVMGFGEVCVKKPACGCFSLKGSALRDENGVRIRIAPSEEHVHVRLGLEAVVEWKGRPVERPFWLGSWSGL